MRTERNFPVRFSRREPIQCSTLYRLTSSFFFALRKYFDTHFWWQCVMPGVVWWVVWAESPIQIKKSYRHFRNRKFETSHRTTRSETGFVILDKFWSRFDLRQRRNRKFLGDDQGWISEQTVQRCVHAHGRVYTHSTVPLLINGGSFSKASAQPLFLEDENIFSKIGLRGTVGNWIPHRT